MFWDALKWLCKKWMLFRPVTSLPCDLAWKKCNPSGTVKSKNKVRDLCGCGWANSLTSSLRSDPGLCMYHWIWACWDLGIHSRNVELLCTPNRTLSSTRPLTRPKENTTVIDPLMIDCLMVQWFICLFDGCVFTALQLQFRKLYIIEKNNWEKWIRTVFCVPALTGRVTMLDVLSSGSPVKQTHKVY